MFPDLLVDPSWLFGRLDDPGLRVVDLRDAEAHARGHIPGAVRLDLAALGSNVGGCENVLLPPSEFAGLMAGLGISNDDAVVACDDQWGLAAARLVWALRHYGLEAAAVLNGGWDRWLEEGGDVVTGGGPVHPGVFVARPGPDVHADTAWVRRSIEAGNVVLLDTRTPTEFAAGHLPGAILWDWFNAVPAGSWNVARDASELLDEWRALGVVPSDEVVVYCRSGMRAAHTWLVLRHAGFGRVRLYDGSWQEWSMKDGGIRGR